MWSPLFDEPSWVYSGARPGWSLFVKQGQVRGLLVYLTIMLDRSETACKIVVVALHNGQLCNARLRFAQELVHADSPCVSKEQIAAAPGSGQCALPIVKKPAVVVPNPSLFSNCLKGEEADRRRRVGQMRRVAAAELHSPWRRSCALRPVPRRGALTRETEYATGIPRANQLGTRLCTAAVFMTGARPSPRLSSVYRCLESRFNSG